jgi:LysM repeat protein
MAPSGVQFNTSMPFPGSDGATGNTVIVKAGETLQQIADRNNVDVKDLMAENQILDPNAILIGRELKLPEKCYLPSQDPAGPSALRPSAPNMGSVDSKSIVDLKLRDATLKTLTDKATAAGLGAKDLALIGSLSALSGAQFEKATSAVRGALESANPVQAMKELGPRIVQGSADPVVSMSTYAMANRTGHAATSFGPGTLTNVEEVTVVAHGNESIVEIGNRAFSPRELAEVLKESGWKGGTIRLAACDTGSANATFAQNLANELDSLGMDSVVIAPKAAANILAGAHGLPQVNDIAGKLLPAGEGWEFFTAAGESTPEIAGAVAGEVLGFVGYMTAPLTLLTNYLGAYEDAKNKIKAGSYEDGFAQGMAVAISGAQKSQFAFRTADPSITDRVLGAEGLREQFHNKGLVDGYKFFESLPADQQKKIRAVLASDGYRVHSSNTYDVLDMQVALSPSVKNLFKQAAEAKQEQELKAQAEWNKHVPRFRR